MKRRGTNVCVVRAGHVPGDPRLAVWPGEGLVLDGAVVPLAPGHVAGLSAATRLAHAAEAAGGAAGVLGVQLGQGKAEGQREGRPYLRHA